MNKVKRYILKIILVNYQIPFTFFFTYEVRSHILLADISPHNIKL